MRNIILITILFFSLHSNSICQAYSNTMTLDGYNLPVPNVHNIVIWLSMDNSEWEAEMRQYEFSERNLSDGCVYYGSGSSLNDAVYTVDRCPGNMIKIVWTDFSRTGRTMFDLLSNELEKHYIDKDETFAYYGLKWPEYLYVFRISREYELEYLIAERISRSENKK